MVDNKDKLVSIVESVLKTLFHDIPEKQKTDDYNDRLNFACPICGDSARNVGAKRGNIYFATNTYKCYNCGTYSSLKKFLFDLREMDLFDGIIPSELLLDSTYDNLAKSISLKNISAIAFDLETLLHKFAIDREKFKELFWCIEVNGTVMEKYLRSRSINHFENFLYRPKFNQLVVLNQDANTGLIISVVTRQFGKQAEKFKYLTYKMSKMYEKLGIDIPDDPQFETLNQLSTYFNILNVDLNKVITYFEGPIDCFFFKNSISLNTVHREPPFVANDTQFLLDFDKEGRKALRKLIGEKKFSFLWLKFLKDIKMPYRENVKIDFNDVVSYLSNNKIKVPSFSKYFSNNPMDIIFI